MPPSLTEVQPKPPAPNKANAGRDTAWDRLRGRANTLAAVLSLFVFLIATGIAVGYFYASSKKAPAAPTSKSTIQTLSQADINKLNEIGANLGTSNQTLNIGANALFRGKADVTGDLSIGGRLNANGPVTLSQLNITGNTAASGLNVGSNLLVTGTTQLQKSLTVNDLTTINSGLNVSGAISAGSINAGSIAVRNLSISGPLSISHLTTQGPAPFIAAGSVGTGGTVSISGNDTAGQVNIGTGTGPGSGPANFLANITFRSAFGANVHVQLTPITPDGATTNAYVTHNNGSFQIRAVNPPSGKQLFFDYLVVQ